MNINLDKFNMTNNYFAGLVGVGFFLLLLLIFFGIALLVFYIICEWKLFKKAGKNGWEAIIPYYNLWTHFEISGLPGWLAVIPLAGGLTGLSHFTGALFAFELIASISLAKKFNKTTSFGVLLAIFPIICLPMLAFGKDEYNKSLGEQKNIFK